MSAGKFIVTLTADFYDSAGTPKYRDIGLSVLAEHPAVRQLRSIDANQVTPLDALRLLDELTRLAREA